MQQTILRDYQSEALDYLRTHWKSAAFMEMGLGKTFIGSEMIKDWMSPDYNVKHVLLLCQKSKIEDWIEHLNTYLPDNIPVINGRTDFPESIWNGVLVINYDLAITPKKKKFFVNLIYSKDFKSKDYGIVCDESSVLQNPTTNRSELMIGTHRNDFNGLGTKFDNVLLLSGTPCNGRYENLFVQAKMLGYEGKRADWLSLVGTYIINKDYGYSYEMTSYIPGKVVNKILTHYGAYFLRAKDVLDLPPVTNTTLKCPEPKEYKKLKKTGMVTDEWGREVVADTTLKQFIEERKMLAINSNKYQAIRDFIQSTDERIIIFTNFVKEYTEVMEICKELNRPVSYITGQGKDLQAYANSENAITTVQYQAGSMGENLQKASILLMTSPPTSAEHYTQSRGRVYREGQKNICRYYEMVGGSLEERIYETVKSGQDFTLALYESMKEE